MKKRNINTKGIITHLCQNGASTKYDLADAIGISIPTVTTNINKLIEEGLLYSAGVVDVEFGRKPMLIDIAYNKYFTLGINIQSKHLYYCLMNLKLESVVEGKLRFGSDLIKDIEEVIDEVLKKASIEISRLKGIGISYPGSVDEKTLTLGTSPVIDLKDICFQLLSKQLDIPIHVGNEANLAALTENILGSSKGHTNTLYLSINEGIGSGIIIDKQYYTGSNNYAGEIGHMVIEKNGKPCGCGARGCSEAYLSTRVLLETFNASLGKDFDGLEKLFEAYEQDNPAHQEVLLDYLDYLVIMINNLFLIFDPDIIIIGGELSLYKAYILEYLDEHITSKESRLQTVDRKIAFSTMGVKTAKYGAALICMKDILLLNE